MQVSIDAMRRENNEGLREIRERIDELKDDYNARIETIEKRCAARQHIVDAHEKFMASTTHSSHSSKSSHDDWFDARVGRWFLGLSTGAIGAAAGAVATVFVKGVLK